MHKFLRAICIGAVILGGALPAIAQERITLTIREVLERPALHFPATGNKAAVLIHQSGWSAESWTPLAELLQGHGVSAVSLVFASSEDVLAAVEFLHKGGAEDITLIGASIGGGAAMQALRSDGGAQIDNIVLLGTSQGDASEVADVPKLFVVTEQDFFASRTHASFAKANEPKRLIVYPGGAHGQEMLDSPYGEQLIGEILKVIAP